MIATTTAKNSNNSSNNSASKNNANSSMKIKTKSLKQKSASHAQNGRNSTHHSQHHHQLHKPSLLSQKRKLIALKEVFKKLRSQYKEILNQEIDAEAIRISELTNLEIKSHMEKILSDHNRKLEQLHFLVKEQIAINSRITGGNFKKYVDESKQKKRQIQKEMLAQNLLKTSKNMIYNNLAWNKLNMLSNLSAERMRIFPSVPRSKVLPRFVMQIEENLVEADIDAVNDFGLSNHKNHTLLNVNNCHDSNKENSLLLTKKPVYFDEEDSSTITSCESPIDGAGSQQFKPYMSPKYNHIPLANSVQNSTKKQFSLPSSIIVSTEIKGVVYCRGDELKVIRAGKVECTGKLLSISDSKLLIKDQKNRMRVDINIKDVDGKNLELMLVSNQNGGIAVNDD